MAQFFWWASAHTIAINNKYIDSALQFIQERPVETIVNMGRKTYRYFDYRLENYTLNSWVKNMSYTIPYIVYSSLFF